VIVIGYINTMRRLLLGQFVGKLKLKTQIFCDVTLCSKASGSRRFEGLSPSSSVSSRIKAKRSFETSEMANFHNPGDLYPHKYHCDKLKSRKSRHIPHLTRPLNLCPSRSFVIYEMFLRTTTDVITFLCMKCATN